jgi:hypothetical protein
MKFASVKINKVKGVVHVSDLLQPLIDEIGLAVFLSYSGQPPRHAPGTPPTLKAHVVLINRDIVPYPKTGNTKPRVHAALFELLFVHKRVHCLSPRTVVC